MSYVGIDPDWYVMIMTSTPCSCGGNPISGTCMAPGRCNASASAVMQPRSLEDYTRFKAEKESKRVEALLAEADAIRATRYQG